MGAERVLGVEINPGIFDSSLAGLPGYGVGERMKADPDFRLVNAEGRSWARASDERFDTVTITFIQTGVANSSAAFALSEANLFTVEAFQEFLALLDGDGVFYVNRHGGNEMLRMISMARAALAELGVVDVRKHLYAAINSTTARCCSSVARPSAAELDASAVPPASSAWTSSTGRAALPARARGPFLELGRLRAAAASHGCGGRAVPELVHAPSSSPRGPVERRPGRLPGRLHGRRQRADRRPPVLLLHGPEPLA